MSKSGTLYGVGVGPGDPELVTLKALSAIRRSPVLAYPQLGPTPSFARAIVAPHLESDKREIVVRVPLGDAEGASRAYDEAAVRLAEELRCGADIAALCEGDPLLYGSFVALWSRLKNDFACEIIPGVSSLAAASARLGVPLATGDDTVVAVPATLSDQALAERIAVADTVAILKVGRHLPRLARLIGRLGLTDRALYIERATLGTERRMTLAETDGAEAPYFSIVLIAKHGAAPQ